MIGDNKIVEFTGSLVEKTLLWKSHGERIVFTNGCFDLLHCGHLRSLEEAKNQGDKLIVGVNSDLAVRKLKGKDRPIVKESDRALLLSALEMVDAVIIFNDISPLSVIKQIVPDVYCKGGDYEYESLPDRELIQKSTGRIHICKYYDSLSTSQLIDKIREYDFKGTNGSS